VSDAQFWPVPTPESQPYWDGCAKGELRLPRCVVCRLLHFFPRSFCPHCWSETLQWEKMSGAGTVASFVRSYRTPAGFDIKAPFVIALVELEEGPRLMSNVVAEGFHCLSVGTPVQAVFRDRRDAVTLPRFVPREGAL
jgi:uncharacterized OB-fold protein